MSDQETVVEKPADSNKQAAEMDCKLKISKCLHSGAKTAEEVETAIKCLQEQGQSAGP